MSKLGQYEVHPLAAVFPLLEGEEYAALVEDIRRNGLRHPILLTHDGQTLIDGRNRFRACMDATVDVVFTKLPASFTERQVADTIMSENLHRRHLDAGQAAFVALAYERAVAAPKAKEREAEAGRSSAPGRPAGKGGERIPNLSNGRGLRARDEAAKRVGVSGRAVQQAKRLEDDEPDLAAKVKAQKMALAKANQEAARRAKQRKAQQPAPDAPPKLAKRTITLRTHRGEPVEYPEPKGNPKFNETPGEGISWARWSWNPVTGCEHGCRYCYAREIATQERTRGAFPVGFTPLFHHERIDAPEHTTVPANATAADRRVFVCSMADLYGGWVPDEWIERVHASEIANPQWTYIHLTKYPLRYTKVDLPSTAWIGTTVDEQKRVKSAEKAFRQIEGVAVKWLSLEPLLEPLEFSDLSMFDWVVIGAQTRTVQPDGVVPEFQPEWQWAFDLALKADAAGCKVHWKPNLTARPNGFPMDG